MSRFQRPPSLWSETGKARCAGRRLVAAVHAAGLKAGVACPRPQMQAAVGRGGRCSSRRQRAGCGVCLPDELSSCRQVPPHLPPYLAFGCGCPDSHRRCPRASAACGPLRGRNMQERTRRRRARRTAIVVARRARARTRAGRARFLAVVAQRVA